MSDIQQGHCANPLCNSQNLIYGAVEFEDDQLYYPYTCVACKSTGREYYNLEFTETIQDEL